MKYKQHDKWRKSFPYYKVGWYDGSIMAWREIQMTFSSRGEADLYRGALSYDLTRVVEVHRKERIVLEG